MRGVESLSMPIAGECVEEPADSAERLDLQTPEKHLDLCRALALGGHTTNGRRTACFRPTKPF